MSIKNISLKSKNIRGEKESMFVKKKKKKSQLKMITVKVSL